MGSGSFGRKDKSATCEKCREKGTIVVHAKRSDTKKPLAGVDTSVDGPTEGRGPTGSNGAKQYAGRAPGSYGLMVTFPQPKYKDWVVLPYSESIVVSAGKTTIAEVLAYPTGMLRVRVVEDGPNGQRPVKTATISGKGPEDLGADRVAEGQHIFAKIRAGEYEVVGSASPEEYEPSRGTVKKVVPDGGEAEAVIKVVPKTWIKLKVHNVEEKKDLPQYSAKLKPTAGAEVLARPGDGGVLELKMARQGQRNCKVHDLDVDEQDVFEVVEVTAG